MTAHGPIAWPGERGQSSLPCEQFARPSVAAAARRTPCVSRGIATAFRALIALSFLLSLLPLQRRIGWATFYTADPALACLTLLFVLSAMQSGGGLRLNWSRNERVLGLLILTLLVSSFFTHHFANTVDQTAIWIRAAAFYVIFRFSLAVGIVTDRYIHNLWLGFLALLLALGLVQLFVDPTAGLLPNYLGENLDESMTYLTNIRISGTTNNSNLFAGWVVIFCLLLTCCHLSPTWRSAFPLSTIIAINAVAFVVLVATLSRGGMAFYIAANLVLFLAAASRGSVRRIAVALGVATLALLCAYGGYELHASMVMSQKLQLLAERLSSFDRSERLTLIDYGFQLLQHPKVLLFGTGLGAFFPALEGYGHGYANVSLWRDLSDARWGIHNAFLRFLVEGGVLVFVVFVRFYLGSLRDSYRRMRMVRGGQWHPFRVFPFVLLVSLAIVPLQLHTSALNIYNIFFVFSAIAFIYDPSAGDYPSAGDGWRMKGSRGAARC